MCTYRFNLYLSGVSHLKTPNKLIRTTFFQVFTGILPESFSCVMANPSSLHLPPRPPPSALSSSPPSQLTVSSPTSLLTLAGMKVLPTKAWSWRGLMNIHKVVNGRDVCIRTCSPSLEIFLKLKRASLRGKEKNLFYLVYCIHTELLFWRKDK